MSFGYKQTEADKTIEKVLGAPVIILAYAVFYFFVGIFILVVERSRAKVITFFTTVLLFLADAYIIYPHHLVTNKLFHIVACFSPAVCLIVIGYMVNGKKKYESEFKEIGFYTRGENTPQLVYKADKKNLANQKYRVLVFKTLIPVSKWYNHKESIENIIADPRRHYTHSINHIERSGTKKIKIYTTTDPYNDYHSNSKIKIDWNDKLLYKWSDSVIMLGLDKMFLKIVKIDLDDKNILIGGEPGSGKSVELKLIVWQLYKHSWELELSDFKEGAEFNEDFEKIAKVITDRKSFLYSIKELNEESERRMKLFRSVKKNNIKGYNKKVAFENRLKRKAFVVDELSCPLDKTGMDKEGLKLIAQIEFYLSELARKGRAAGIHLILCMQRPDADILKGQIKNMLGIRISGRFADGTASKIILDNTMATQLPAIQGRLILKDGANLTEFQGYYFDMEDYASELYTNEELEQMIDEDLGIDDKKVVDFENARADKTIVELDELPNDENANEVENKNRRSHLSYSQFKKRKQQAETEKSEIIEDSVDIESEKIEQDPEGDTQC